MLAEVAGTGKVLLNWPPSDSAAGLLPAAISSAQIRLMASRLPAQLRCADVDGRHVYPQGRRLRSGTVRPERLYGYLVS